MNKQDKETETNNSICQPISGRLYNVYFEFGIKKYYGVFLFEFGDGNSVGKIGGDIICYLEKVYLGKNSVHKVLWKNKVGFLINGVRFCSVD